MPRLYPISDRVARCYLSHFIATPSAVWAVDDIIGAITGRNLEFCVVPNLWDLCDTVVNFTLHFT